MAWFLLILASLFEVSWAVGLKSFTVFPNNVQQQRPSVQGAMLIFDDQTGTPLAVVDSGLVTYWKTAADSVYGASLSTAE